VEDGDYSRTFGNAVVALVRDRYVASQASPSGAATPASVLPYEGDLKAAMAAGDRPAIKHILAHRDAAKKTADKNGDGDDNGGEVKNDNDDSSSSSSSSESDNEDEKNDSVGQLPSSSLSHDLLGLPPLPGLSQQPQNNSSTGLPPLPPLPSQTPRSPPFDDPRVEEEANIIWDEIRDGNLTMEELPEVTNVQLDLIFYSVLIHCVFVLSRDPNILPPRCPHEKVHIDFCVPQII